MYDCSFEKGNHWFRYRTGGILIHDIDLSSCKRATDIGEELVWVPIEEIENSNIKPEFIKENIYRIINERKTIHVIEERDR